MVKVIPSAPTNDLGFLEEIIHKSEGVVKRFSVDVVDGKYAQNKTIDPSALEDFDTTLLLDFQLMVVEPVNWIKKCVTAGGDRVIGHVEYMSDQIDFIAKVEGMGAKVGLGLDLATPISRLEDQALASLDVVLLMSVPAGFGGQKFNRKVLMKIKEMDMYRKKNKCRFKIHIDGGITAANIKSVVEAGADEVSIGKRIFNGDLKKNIRELKQSAK